MTLPRNLTELFENSHFSVFSVTPFSSSLFSTFHRRPSWVDCVSAWTSTSSIWHSTPSKPSSILDILRWKCSGADEIPKHKRLKQYRPNGVMNVVSNLESSERGICQNPEFASNFENTLAPSS